MPESDNKSLWLKLPSPSSSSATDSLCSDESFEEVFMKNESGDGEIILMPKTKAITPGKSARSSYTILTAVYP